MSRAVSAAARVAPELTVYGVLRSGLVLAGILLLAVGLGDMITGRTKVVQYHAALAQTPTEPVDPTALFPTSNEGAERHAGIEDADDATDIAAAEEVHDDGRKDSDPPAVEDAIDQRKDGKRPNGR